MAIKQLFFLFLRIFDKQARSILLIQSKEKLNSTQFSCKGFRAVALIYGFVQCLMRFYQIGRHGGGVVQIGKAAVGVSGARIEYGLRGFFYFFLLGIGGGEREGEVVVNVIFGEPPIVF